MHKTGSRRVVIVGGGVVGCATAYQLARAGFTVTIIDRDEIGAHASGHNAGNLNPLHETSQALLPFTLASYHLHTAIRAELIQLGYSGALARPVNRIHLAYDEADRAHLQKTTALFNSVDGFSSRWLDTRELSRIEPRLHGNMSLGVLTSGGLAIDGYDFTRALAEAATRFGATLLQAAVLGIITSGGRVTAIQTALGVMPCDEVVFATGPWVAGPKTWLGIEVPVEPVKGELLLLQFDQAPPVYDFTWRSICLYRRRRNEVWLGGTMDRCGFDTSPTAAVREFLLNSTAEILPDIRKASLLRHVAALRPVSRTNAPIASAASGWENVYIANGGGSKGVLLSVGIAKTICDLLLHRCSDFPHVRLPSHRCDCRRTARNSRSGLEVEDQVGCDRDDSSLAASDRQK